MPDVTCTNLTVSANAAIEGNLQVGMLATSSNTQLYGNLSINRDSGGVGGSLNAAGSLTADSLRLQGTALVAGAALEIAGGGLNVSGDTNLNGPVTIGGSLTISTALSVGAGATVGGPVTINGGTTIGGTLQVAGIVTLAGPVTINNPLYAGTSEIYFSNPSHNHTGLGNTPGHAAIENAADYDALMILGRAGTTEGRKVRLWDYLGVNGNLEVTGWVAVGTSSPQRKLHVEDSEIHSGGANAGLSFSNRGSTFAPGGNNGERWVIYSYDKVARLWSTSDQYYFKPDGEFGRAHTSATLSLFGSRISDTGDGVLSLRSGGLVVALDGGDQVGIGLRAPLRKLHVHSDDWGQAAEIHASGSTAGISFTDREVGRTWDTANVAGTRWVWYSSGRSAKLWTPGHGDVLGVKSNRSVNIAGRIGVGGYDADNVPGDLGGGLRCWDVVYSGGLHHRSTIRVKQNIRPLGNVLGRIEQLNPVAYDRHEGQQARQNCLGFVAEELRAVFPECTSGDGDFFAWGIDESSLHALTVAGLQELSRQVKALRRRSQRNRRGVRPARTLPGAPHIQVISQANDTDTPGGRYITARFSASHPRLGALTTVRTLRLAPGSSHDTQLRDEAARWLASLEPSA